MTHLPPAAELDAQDPLARFRSRFVLDPTLIYLDGNSLGRLPKAAVARMQALVEREWGQRLIRSWNESWLALPRRIGSRIAELAGARPDEVIMADSTSVNLYKLVVAALRALPERAEVITDNANFPSDLYVLRSAVESSGPGRRLVVLDVTSPRGVPLERLQAKVSDNTALVVLSHVTYQSGYAYPIDHVTRIAHEAGAWVVWDVSHSVGVVPLELTARQVDLAVGCTYKYLNGGPGAPAFLYVRQEIQPSLANPIAGWFGHRCPFAFDPHYEPSAGIDRFAVGTPPILSLAMTEPGVELAQQAGLPAIRAKSVALGERLVAHWHTKLAPLGFSLESPTDSGERGSHVALGHPEGRRISRLLSERFGIIPDFRPPGLLRLGLAPLFTTFSELDRAVDALQQTVTRKLYETVQETPGEVP
jgi:kynureninase